MEKIKVVLAAIGALALVVVAIWLIGMVSAIFWFLLWAGLLGAVGYGGYKLFFGKEKTTARLEEKTPVGISGLGDADRALEEYKRKYLAE